MVVQTDDKGSVMAASDANDMFGTLFEEPDMPVVYGCAPKPVEKVNGGSVEAPPPGRGETGFCGIKNQGATCYLNSLIQTLLLTPELREKLFSLGPDELGRLEDIKRAEAKVRKIPIQLQMLLARLLLLDQYACGTEGLTESFGWVDSEQLQQHDVQELSRILFCAIEDSLVGTSGHEIIKKLYRGVIANTITCLNCHKVSERLEDFLDLNIAIATRNRLTNVLHDMFVETELMNGKNQYRCEKCEKLVDAKKGAVIKTLPPILTVSLLRFSFDYSTLRRYKEMGRFEFPLTLNMRPYCRTEERECFEYDLYSVIIHSGSAHGGHYHAYIRDIDGLGTVPPDYDPTPVLQQPCTEKSDATTTNYFDDPVAMLACVLGKFGGESVPITKLGEGFREESGTSWGKLYRKKHGTMTKFLQYHSDTFSVDFRLKTVSFRSKSRYSDYADNINPQFVCNHFPPTNGSGDGGGGELYENCDDLTEQNKPASFQVTNRTENSHIKSQITNGSQEEQSGTDSDMETHPLCNIWFDFNDSHVTPITTHDIARQYEGRESAYMLFYRRKDLKRPLESLGNSSSRIPGHIKSMIQQENSKLDDRRSEYDSLLNLVRLRIFLPSMLRRKDGLMKLIDPSEVPECGFSYSIDRRKTITEMMMELEAEVEKYQKQSLEDAAFQCNILKVLEHGGVHLYDRIDQDPSILVDDSLLNNDVNILYWNGKPFDGLGLKFGESSEPILLNVHCEVFGGGDLVSTDFKGTTFSDLLMGDLEKYFASKFKPGCCSKIGRTIDDKFIEFTEAENMKTLGELKTSYEEDVNLKIDLNCEREGQVSDSGERLKLFVSPGEILLKRFCKRSYPSTDEVFHLTSISGVAEVESSLHVEELKLSVLNWLLAEYVKEYEMDMLHLYACMEPNTSAPDGLDSKLRLHENQSLMKAGLSGENNAVKLEIGPPPDEFEYHVVVYVQRGNKLKLPIKKSQAISVVLNKRNTVSQFIECLISNHNLTKDAWHLKCLKSDREVGDFVFPVECSIEKSAIKHGCSLLLCPGNIPSAGSLSIPIWYFPTLLSFEDILDDCEQSEWSIWGQSLERDDQKPEMVGHVEIGREATLFDLKREIVKLQFFGGVKTFEDICVRSVSQKLPSRFHLQETSSVKRLRLGLGNPLAVQDVSAVPESNFVALCLTFHRPGTRTYANACEYKRSQLAPLSHLPFELSKILKLTVKEILIARQTNEPWEWEIIKAREGDSNAKEGKNKVQAKKSAKQKKGQGKTKSKKTLSKSQSGSGTGILRDGDIIRIKNIEKECQFRGVGPEISDFKSDEDLVLFQRSQDTKLRDVNALNIVNEPPDSDSQPTTPSKCDTQPNSNLKKEETLRIHVDKF